MITKFQSELSEEIAAIRKQNGGKKTETYDDQRIHSSRAFNIYNFQSDDLSTWRRRRTRTEVAITIDDELISGSLESKDSYSPRFS